MSSTIQFTSIILYDPYYRSRAISDGYKQNKDPDQHPQYLCIYVFNL